MVFSDWVLSLPAADQPKTAAYAELDDPFAAPIAESIRLRFETAGIKTVYKQVYPAETQDFSAIMSKVATANPDVLVSGTQSEDAYAQVKSLIQLKFSPKFMFMSNGANSPAEFPDKVGARTPGHHFGGRLVPRLDRQGERRVHRRLHQGVRRHRGHDRQQQRRGLRGRAGAGGGSEQDREDRQRDDHRTLHQGTWPTLVGDLSWDANGAPNGSFNLIQWQGGKLVPVFPASIAAGAAGVPEAGMGRVTNGCTP